MKANSKKYHLLLSSKAPTESLFGGLFIKFRTKETFYGALIDSKFGFDEHISFICTKISRKINKLGRIANFMSYWKRRLIMRAFIKSQFNYCASIWMFHSQTLSYKKINHLHKRALKIAYSDCKSSFNELLQNNTFFAIHDRNIQSVNWDSRIFERTISKYHE